MINFFFGMGWINEMKRDEILYCNVITDAVAVSVRLFIPFIISLMHNVICVIRGANTCWPMTRCDSFYVTRFQAIRTHVPWMLTDWLTVWTRNITTKNWFLDLPNSFNARHFIGSSLYAWNAIQRMKYRTRKREMQMNHIVCFQHTLSSCLMFFYSLSLAFNVASI